MILHQTIPHLHHENEEDHSHKNAEHGHSHDHQHQHESKDLKSFLSVLFAMHSHGNSSETPVVQLSQEQISLKKITTQNPSKGADNFNNYYSLYTDADTALITNYRPPPKYSKLYFKFDPLRGPPHWV